jgi:hemerythrin superfamily protein
MNAIANRLCPDAITMIRFDHTHVVATFHQYRKYSAPRVKEGLVKTVCTALEVHAQLEEEIFYPAVRAVIQDEAIRKSVPEHDEMRRVIAQLRDMAPTDARYDETFMELMRDVLHHVADEETVVLPEAERLLGDRLDELGGEMTRRRIELVVPRTGEIALNLARAMPMATTVAVGLALVSGAALATWYGGQKMKRLD